jgi:hypothetical protein
MNYKILNVILFLIFIGTVHLSYSQKEVNVVTKTIKKDLKVNSKTLTIKGEKSNINITSWEKDFYSVELRLISKNLNKKQAETDLNIVKYEITENSNDYLLKNYFGSEKFSNVKSNLSVIYNIKVPYNCKLDISNIYGDISLTNINSTSKISNSFGEIHIIAIEGNYTLNAYYSDLFVKDVDLGVNCITDKSDVEMINVSGTIKVKSNYGKIDFSPGKSLLKLEIDAKRTAVFLNDFNLNSYNYSLSTTSAGIVFPDIWKVPLLKEGNKVLFNVNSGTSKPNIKVQTTYCQISITTK